MKKVLVYFLLLFLFSCVENKFTTEKWLPVDAIYQNKRIKMIDDLLENHIHFGMKLENAEKLLGEPQEKDSLSIEYIIEEKYGIIDPIGHVYLKLDFNKELKLIQWNIIETGYKE